MAYNEDAVQVAPPGGGKNIRNIQLTTIINGVPTTVDMQVVALSDQDGNIFNLLRNFTWEQAVLDELRALRRLFAAVNGQAAFMPDPLSTTLSNQGV